MPASKADVVAFLKECSGGELSDIMRQALANRPEAAPEPDAFEYRLFLGLAVHENIAPAAGQFDWAPWRLAAVAYLNPDSYRQDFSGEPFCQWGQCDGCGTKVCSHVKDSLCPVCGRQVLLT